MALGIYRHFSQATLESMLSTAQTIAADPERIVEWESEQTRVKHENALPFIAHLEEINYALSLKDPDEYGKVITRTLGRF